MRDPWKIFAVVLAALALGWGIFVSRADVDDIRQIRAELEGKANQEAVAHLQADMDFRWGVIQEEIKEIRADVKKILDELRKVNGYRQ